MKIEDALKENGKATYPMWDKDAFVHIVHSEFIDHDGNPYYCSHLLDNNWEPYHPEIRPKEAGELWRHGTFLYFVARISGSSLEFISGGGQSVTGIFEAVHGKDGLTRIFPPVEEILPDEEFDDDEDMDLLKDTRRGFGPAWCSKI